MLEYIIPSVVGCVSGIIGTYLVAKRMFSTSKILEIWDTILTDVMSNTETQKKVYSIGALIGNGLKTGVGLGGKGGKFKIEDIIAQFIMGKVMPQGNQPQQQQFPDWIKP